MDLGEAGKMPLTLRERQAVVQELRAKYKAASKGGKSEVLDQVTELLGYNRCYAARVLRQRNHAPHKKSLAQSRQGRKPLYDLKVQQALAKVWAIMNFSSGKRLAPFMREIVTALERHGELQLPSEVRQKLLQMSPATIDRLLAHR
jgi:hypothetical protein